MSADGIVGLVLAVALSSTGAAVVTGLWNRRKLGADATRIITDAAATVVKNLHDENADLRTRIERLERQAAADRSAQQLHVAWDQLACERLGERGVILPPPPPLYAPEVA